MDTKAEAEAFRFLLPRGLVSNTAIVAWADRLIAATAEPPPALLDVSLGAHASVERITELLAEMPGKTTFASTYRALLPWLKVAAARSSPAPYQVARALHHLYWSLDEEQLEPDGTMVGMDDLFEMAAEGIYGTEAEALTELRSWLDDEARRRGAA